MRRTSWALTPSSLVRSFGLGLAQGFALVCLARHLRCFLCCCTGPALPLTQHFTIRTPVTENEEDQEPVRPASRSSHDLMQSQPRPQSSSGPASHSQHPRLALQVRFASSTSCRGCVRIASAPLLTSLSLLLLVFSGRHASDAVSAAGRGIQLLPARATGDCDPHAAQRCRRQPDLAGARRRCSSWPRLVFSVARAWRFGMNACLVFHAQLCAHAAFFPVD